jgi:hypothetical protein
VLKEEPPRHELAFYPPGPSDLWYGILTAMLALLGATSVMMLVTACETMSMTL